MVNDGKSMSLRKANSHPPTPQQQHPSSPNLKLLERIEALAEENSKLRGQLSEQHATTFSALREAARERESAQRMQAERERERKAQEEGTRRMSRLRKELEGAKEREGELRTLLQLQ
eukprot:1757934-Rhodomonas_salina.2